jgi:histidinol-phosphate aminotransferase
MAHGGPRLRAELDTIPSYRAGQAAPEFDGLTAYKLSSNENPYPPLPSVAEATVRALADLHRYPDYSSSRLVSHLAGHFDVPEADLAVGTGSVGLLQQLFQISSGPGDGVVFAWRSFEAYPIITQIVGATAQVVALDSEQRHDLDGMLAAVDHTTRLVLVCNPNNPTSTAVGRDALSRFVEAVPDDVLVVIDEAYHEFVDPTQIPDGLDYYRERDNVAVLRTFSKAYGLAALRVGFCIAPEPVADALRKVQVPFGVSTVAQAAAVASLDAEDELLERVSVIVAERLRVSDGLKAIGLAPAESEANFVWLGLGPDTPSFASACEGAALAVRPFGTDGVRITIGEPEANSRLLMVAGEWLSARR